MNSGILLAPEWRGWKVAGWQDIQEKATRLRREHQADVLTLTPTVIAGKVKGDHGTYETTLKRQFPGSWKITQWECSCPWYTYDFDRSPDYKHLEDRPCSHAMALLWQAYSQVYRKMPE